MPTVVVHHDLPIAGNLRGQREQLDVIEATDRDSVLASLDDAEFFVVNPANWDDAFLDHLHPGDWIQATSVGYDAFPLDELRRRDVTLTNAAGNYAPVVSEHAFALALAVSRKLPALHDMQSVAEWDRGIGLDATDWADRTMTVLGLGRIGEAIARKGLGFDMTVFGVKRTPEEYDGCLPSDRVVGPDGFYGLLPGTDLLVAIVPLTDETHHLVDAEVFDRLPDSAVLVNVARGPVVDESALLDALETDRIAAAGLDVFETEPLPADSPLWDRDDVIVTPHVAGRSDRFGERFAALFLENYDRSMGGRPLRNEIVGRADTS